jgi:diguanylate cyclase (GGDEF)-like protein
MIEVRDALQAGGLRWEPGLPPGSADFRASARSTLAALRSRLDYPTWVVAEHVNDDWRVVEALDRPDGLRPGHVMTWSDTLCSRMVAGHGPRVAGDIAEIPAYASAPAAATLRVGSYLGVPLAHEGVVGGVLCAFDREPRPATATDLPLVELMAGMLATIRVHEARSVDFTRRVARAEADAMVDPLTQLGTRLAWNQALAEEEARCVRTGRQACVITLDLDGLKRVNDSLGHDAGDRLIRAAAIALRRTSRLCDHVVRLGGDEFGVIAVECDGDSGAALLGRIERALSASGIDASLGYSPRDPLRGLEGAWLDADAAMYADKRARRRQRVSAALADPHVVLPSQALRLTDADDTEEAVSSAR